MQHKKGYELRKEVTEAITREALEQIGVLINKGTIKNFKEVFDHIPRSRLGETLGFNKSGFLRTKSLDGSVWRVEDILRFSEFTGAEPELVFKLLVNYKIQSLDE